MLINLNRAKRVLKSIELDLAAKEYKPQIVIHRGHSYFAEGTIKRLTPDQKIVFLGSCGGFKNIEKVLGLSPEAVIIATRGVGTMHVNNPLLLELSNTIRKADLKKETGGNVINWPEFWKKAKDKLGANPDFDKYISPHSNTSTLLIKAIKGRI